MITLHISKILLVLQQATILGICIKPGKVVAIFKVTGIVFLVPFSEVLRGHQTVYTVEEKSVFPMESSIYYERHF